MRDSWEQHAAFSDILGEERFCPCGFRYFCITLVCQKGLESDDVCDVIYYEKSLDSKEKVPVWS